jgi:hypothetical protein
MKLGVLQIILRKLRPRMRRQPEPEGQKVLMAEETIDNLLARDSGDAEELEEFLDSAIQDRIAEIQELNESLRGKN